jgi:hypothetical protein
MGKNQSASNLTNIIKQDANGSIAFMSGSTMLMSLSNTGQMSGSVPVLSASTASFVANAQSASYVLTAQTASFVANAQSASNAVAAATASFVALAQSASNAVSAQTASFANTFTVNSTLTAQTLVVQTITSSVVYSSGSNVFGNDIANTQTFTGSVNITGSTNLVGSLKVNKIGINTGNINLDNHSSNLIVSGAIAFANAGGGTAALVDRDGSGNTTFYGNTGDIRFIDATFTSNYLTIKSAGNVGIGTTDPSYRLHVSGAFSSNPGLYVYGTTYGMVGVDRGGAAASAGVNYYTTGSQRWFAGIYENTNNFGFYNAR